jgi:hypothetical protein
MAERSVRLGRVHDDSPAANVHFDGCMVACLDDDMMRQVCIVAWTKLNLDERTHVRRAGRDPPWE